MIRIILQFFTSVVIYASHTLLGLALFKQVLSRGTSTEENKCSNSVVVGCGTVTLGKTPRPPLWPPLYREEAELDYFW